MLDRFARFGLPLHLTETTLVSGHLMPPEIVDLNDYQVAVVAVDARGRGAPGRRGRCRHYRRCSRTRPSRRSTYWGFTDDGGWLGAPAGLVRVDGTPKPAYERLRGLVKGDWWLPPTPLHTDDDGVLRFTGFLGDYEVAAAEWRAALSLDAPGPIDLTVGLG